MDDDGNIGLNTLPPSPELQPVVQSETSDEIEPQPLLGTSLSFSGPVGAADFLQFVHTLWGLDIPIVNPIIVDPSHGLASGGKLGKGGQSEVDRIYDNQRWPEKPDLRMETSVVVKRVRRFGDTGLADTSNDAKDLEAFHREIKVLGRLRHHRNIVKLVGIAWENAGVVADSEFNVRPMLVLEYAHLGSLESFLRLERGACLSFSQITGLCSDVAGGLSALHAHEIIWGDCKPENILIFPDEDTQSTFRAKLSDFGISEPEPLPNSVFRGMSRPWTAPEVCVGSTVLAPRGFEQLKRSEIYSFGLIVWYISTNGACFNGDRWGVGGGQDGRTATYDKIDALKCTAGRGLLAVARESMGQHILKSGDHPIASAEDVQLLCSILEECLQYEPTDRASEISNLAKLLNPQFMNNISLIRPLTVFTGDLDVGYSWVNFGPSTGLELVGKTIYERICDLTNSTQWPQYYFQEAIFNLIGFGTESNISKALSLMRKSARLGNSKASSLLGRLETIHHRTSPDAAEVMDFQEDLILMDSLPNELGMSSNPASASLDLTQLLQEAASNGSWIAAEDLREIDLQLFMDNIISTSRFMGNPFNASIMESGIHLLAISGDESGCESILQQSPEALDLENDHGETPLICAMRGGHPELALRLLCRGANINHQDHRGVTALHWVISLDVAGMSRLRTQLRHARLDAQSSTKVQYSEYLESMLLPGTALDWAVDVRNTDAVSLLLGLGASALVSNNQRPPALHRAASHHDIELLKVLRNSRNSSNFDLWGKSPLAFALDASHPLERRLIACGNNTVEDAITLLVDFNKQWLDHVNALKEHALYYAVRQGSVDAVKAILQLLKKRSLDVGKYITVRNGPNQWSALRRALYAKDPEVLKALCEALPSGPRPNPIKDVSADGLSLLHELAFVPSELAVRLFQVIKRHLHKSIYRRRLPARERNISEISEREANWRHRPRMTPFQMAVICQNIQLAEHWANLHYNDTIPLLALERRRFLGYVIEYQRHEAYTLSAWLSKIDHDPVPNVLRRFPHPSAIRASVSFLLRNDNEWWQNAIPSGWVSRYIPWQYADIPFRLDEDKDHEPMISWSPGVFTAVEESVGASNTNLTEGLGTGGLLDANALAFQHRRRHTADFGSFLVSYQADTQKHSVQGHKFLTAIELAFEMIRTCPPYAQEAEDIFLDVLETYGEARHCNFPYYFYYPLGRTPARNLSRRETLLHQAIRAQRPRVVQSLLEHSADCEMANNNWQSPLKLAEIMCHPGQNPDLHEASGSFIERLWLSLPPRSVAINSENRGTGVCAEIYESIEEQVRLRHKSFWHLPSFLRALQEVHWPWNEYETDDLGIRFAIFYFLLIVIVISIVALPVYFITVAMPRFVAKVLYEISYALEPLGLGILGMADCFMNSTIHGLDARGICVTDNNAVFRNFTEALIPPTRPLRDTFGTWIENLDKCYNGTVPPWLGNSTWLEPPLLTLFENGTLDYVPGCPNLTERVETEDVMYTKEMVAFLEEECRCTCTREGEAKSRPRGK